MSREPPTTAKGRQKEKHPEKFTLGELSILAKIFGVDITVLVVSLKNEGWQSL